MTKQDFWFEDITTLLDKDYLNDFIPLVEMTDYEKLNAMVRFCIYLSVLLILFTNNVNYIFIIIGILILTYAIYTIDTKKHADIKNELLAEMDVKYRKYADVDKAEAKANAEATAPAKAKAKATDDDECLKPTRDNIFANISLNKMKLDNCNENLLDKQMNEHIEQDRFIESNANIFEDKMSLRQFYKVPNENDADSRKKFMEWCYNSP
jgi:hypothetical protein